MSEIIYIIYIANRKRTIFYIVHNRVAAQDPANNKCCNKILTCSPTLHNIEVYHSIIKLISDNTVDKVGHIYSLIGWGGGRIPIFTPFFDIFLLRIKTHYL